MVILHRTTLDTMSKIVGCILSHNPPYILFLIASCNKHGLKANWIPISIEEMETLGSHTSHSSNMLICKTYDLFQLSSIYYLNWII